MPTVISAKQKYKNIESPETTYKIGDEYSTNGGLRWHAYVGDRKVGLRLGYLTWGLRYEEDKLTEPKYKYFKPNTILWRRKIVKKNIG